MTIAEVQVKNDGCLEKGSSIVGKMKKEREDILKIYMSRIFFLKKIVYCPRTQLVKAQVAYCRTYIFLKIEL